MEATYVGCYFGTKKIPAATLPESITNENAGDKLRI